MFLSRGTLVQDPYDIFVDRNDTVYVTDITSDIIHSWHQGNGTPIQMIKGNLTNPYSLFVTGDNDIYFSNNNGLQVERSTANSTGRFPVLPLFGDCYSLFIDINNTLYCSLGTFHQVIAKNLEDTTDALKFVIGTGCLGSTTNTLNYPSGIFVDLNFDVYVADTKNNRIQRFRANQLNGTTVVGSRGLFSFSLSSPTDIVLDYDGNLFILDNGNNRIVRSGSNVSSCIIGCSSRSKRSGNTLKSPRSMSFDSHGNIFVTDQGNKRVVKFILGIDGPGKFTKFFYYLRAVIQVAAERAL